MGDWSNRALPADDEPVGRDPLVGPHDHGVADAQFLDRHLNHVIAAPHAGGRRGEFGQHLDCPPRPAHRVVLQRVPNAEQEQQQPALEELAQRRSPGRGDEHQEVDLELPAADFADRLLHGEIPAEEIGREVERQRHAPVDRREGVEEPADADAQAAGDGEDELDVEAEDHAVGVCSVMSLAGSMVVELVLVVAHWSSSCSG